MHQRMLRAAQAMTRRRVTDGIVAIRSVMAPTIATAARNRSPPDATIATSKAIAAVTNTATAQSISVIRCA